MERASSTPEERVAQLVRKNYDLLMKWELYPSERPDALAEADKLVIEAIHKLRSLQNL